MLTCGQNSVIAAENIGCGKHVEENDAVFCSDCRTPFHAECLEAHKARWTKWGAKPVIIPRP